MRTSVLLRTSERGSFKRCRQQWWWGFVEKLKPSHEPVALRFGDLIHQSLAAYYKPGTRRGPKPAATFRRLYAEAEANAMGMGFRDNDGKWIAAAELGETMLVGYHDLYHERDLRYRVIASEQTFRWRVSRRLVYVGTFDGVWEDMADPNRPLILPEHKTTSKVAKTWDHLDLDEQGSAYWTYAPAWLVRQGWISAEDVERFIGILYNFLVKRLPDDRPEDAHGRKLNQNGAVSKNQPSPLFVRPPLVYRDLEARRRQHARIKVEAAEMERVRSGELPVYKNPGPLHLPNCLGCGFREMCQLHEIGADWESYKRAGMRQWEPYEDHDPDPHGDIIYA